jgi:vacuolar-type H+-ATPase subunit H
VEVILIIKKRQKDFKQKINELKHTAKDEIFQEDMREISQDFESIDSEGW